MSTPSVLPPSFFKARQASGSVVIRPLNIPFYRKSVRGELLSLSGLGLKAVIRDAVTWSGTSCRVRLHDVMTDLGTTDSVGSIEAKVVFFRRLHGAQDMEVGLLWVDIPSDDHDILLGLLAAN